MVSRSLHGTPTKSGQGIESGFNIFGTQEGTKQAPAPDPKWKPMEKVLRNARLMTPS